MALRQWPRSSLPLWDQGLSGVFFYVLYVQAKELGQKLEGVIEFGWGFGKKLDIRLKIGYKKHLSPPFAYAHPSHHP